MAKKTGKVLTLEVSFASVNIGDKIASIGVTIDRDQLTAKQADDNLVGRRLTGRALARAADTQAKQESLPGLEEDVHIDGAFDVNGVSLRPKSMSFKISFSIKDIDVNQLIHFAKREGKLMIDDVEVITELEKPRIVHDDDEDEDNSDDDL